MRHPFTKLVALSLLLLAVLQPPTPTQPPRQPPAFSSRSISTDWTPLRTASEIKLWHETRFYLIAEAQQKQLEGNLGAMAEQEAEQLDGDRFDRLAACESGGDPTTNTGNGYFGAFQWLLSTWHAAGGTGNPVDHSYTEQKAVAMHWATVANPYTQWPVCWPRSA